MLILVVVFFTQTFSADNIEGFNGTSNPACIKDEVKEPERNSNKLQHDNKSDASEQEDREEDDHNYAPGMGFV